MSPSEQFGSEYRLLRKPLHRQPTRSHRAVASGRLGLLGKEGAGAYTRAMRRPITVAAALLLAALIVAGGVLALRPLGARQPIYTVAQVTMGGRLRALP